MCLDIVGKRVNLAQSVQLPRQVTVNVVHVDEELAVDIEISLLPAARNVPHCRQLFTERLAFRAWISSLISGTPYSLKTSCVVIRSDKTISPLSVVDAIIL